MSKYTSYGRATRNGITTEVFFTKHQTFWQWLMRREPTEAIYVCRENTWFNADNMLPASPSEMVDICTVIYTMNMQEKLWK